MNVEQIRELLTSLAVLNQQGEIPVQAYCMLVGNHSPELLADQLHQRWLSDEKFVNIAANIVLHIHKADKKNMALPSATLALLLNDYRNRLEVRSKSAQMFRNSVRTLFDMYPIYEKIDEYVCQCFIKPMFKSLDMLIDNNPEPQDIETMAVLLTRHGKRLNELNSFWIDNLITKIRAKLCSDDPAISSDLRRILLHVHDLWSFGWNELLIPEILTTNYTEETPSELPIQRKREEQKTEFFKP
ncbi:unnamed protein product [Auanema sp. JU1783]|nr:unnamed protein product [Auanema sp. JU1783]